MTHILITDLREIRYMAYVPEEPKKEKYGYEESIGFDGHPAGWTVEGGEDAYWQAMDKHKLDLEKAKREALPFEDLDLITLTIAEHLLPDTYTIGDIEKFRQEELKPGIYQVPVEVEVFYYLPWRNEFVTTKDCVFNKSEATKVVARIVDKPSQTPALDKVFKTIPRGKYDQHYKGEPKEESQEEIVQAFFIEYNRLMQGGRPQHSAALKLLDKFSLTRKRG